MRNRNLYPKNWFDTIRPAILLRDNYRCVQCRVVHRSEGYYDKQQLFIECDVFMIAWAKANGFKTTTIYLQVAHINQDVTNCEYSNLQAMCNRCHLEFDRPYNNIKRKAAGRQNSQ